jgi:TonB family protein
MNAKIYIRTICSSILVAVFFFPNPNAVAQSKVDALPYGGNRLLKEFIHEELVYPEDALAGKQEGVVQMIIYIDERGHTEKIDVIGSVSPQIDQEALRIMRKVLWEPATFIGQSISDEIFYEIDFNVKKYERICKERGYSQIIYLREPVDLSGRIFTAKEVDSIPHILFEDKKMTLSKFITEQIEYPKDAFLNDISGTETLFFIVEPSGRLSNIRPEKHLGGGCCEEAIRLVKLLKWYPGVRDDLSVRIMMNISITFNLQEGSEYQVIPAYLNTSL